MNYKDQYGKQRNRAKDRNIDWHFTYETWLDWWGDDITKRGRKKEDLVMSRINDTGAYAPDNCKKITQSDNSKERQQLQGKEIGKKISAANKGKTPWNKDTHGVMIAWNKGKTFLDKRGSNHPGSKAIKTPFGVFGSIKEAARSIPMSDGALYYKLTKNKEGYEYIDKQPNGSTD